MTLLKTAFRYLLGGSIVTLFLFMSYTFSEGRGPSASILNSLRAHDTSGFFGASKHRRFVSLSADDWGRWTDAIPLWADLEHGDHNEELQQSTNVWKYGTVETAEDLQGFEQLMRSVNQGASFLHRVVVTPFWIIGGPDFDSMRELGCDYPEDEDSRCFSNCPGNEEECSYRELTLDSSTGGLDRAPFHRGDLTKLYHRMYDEGLWHPEYHGKVHFSMQKWMQNLVEGGNEGRAAKCLRAGVVCGDQYDSLRSEYPGFDGDEQGVREHMAAGIDSFQRFWGYQPVVSSAPHNAWTPEAIRGARANGLIGLDLNVDQVREFQKHDPDMGMLDRERFDMFWPQYNCSQRKSEIITALDEKEYVPLMWHAQNVLHSTYRNGEVDRMNECFMDTIAHIREQRPDTVFVTAGEMHQIRLNGWSREIWSDRVVYRNYNNNEDDMEIEIPNLRDLNTNSADWTNKKLSVTEIRPDGSETQWKDTSLRVGDEIDIPHDSVLIVRAL